MCVCFNQTPVGRKPIVSEKGNHVALPAGQTMCFISTVDRKVLRKDRGLCVVSSM